ncbi:hypothetical protein B5C34_02090 [Pacificimonas flava]|uniref:Uncharacterized protein n=2 Tax=Pacificimonas TaxID=1960290 RepID=A0A219B2K7_9SPHN|nr:MULTISPECIES: hypothetical protein [Pacificimonas]MBZ6377991.1 hypothetical protein [Pacificimonas aurantium]OWV32363.1 hypothetical protein B5C34_02090 [Pacificimonas flava]
MLTKGDEYPIHQRPEPVATAGTDRNFYDRYFLNGYAPDGSLFFGGALGVYPHLAVMDAAFSVNDQTDQQSVFASRKIVGGERMDMTVEPISIEVIEPLVSIRFRVAGGAGEPAADLTMTARAEPIEEPRFTYAIGTRTLMDVTRLTQSVKWDGWIEKDGKRIEVDGWWGTRDRSWGVRPVGASDPQGPTDPSAFQFYWLWSPLNFPDHAFFWHTNDDAAGHAWNRDGKLVDLKSGKITKLVMSPELEFKPCTRNAKTARLVGQDGTTVNFELGRNFHMHGIGYGHPTRGHGTAHGDHSVHRETHRLAEVDLANPGNVHVQAMAQAVLTLPDGKQHRGRGVLEQLYVGPHAPSGFKDMFDLA